MQRRGPAVTSAPCVRELDRSVRSSFLWFSRMAAEHLMLLNNLLLSLVLPDSVARFSSPGRSGA